ETRDDDRERRRGEQPREPVVDDGERERRMAERELRQRDPDEPGVAPGGGERQGAPLLPAPSHGTRVSVRADGENPRAQDRRGEREQQRTVDVHQRERREDEQRRERPEVDAPRARPQVLGAIRALHDEPDGQRDEVGEELAGPPTSLAAATRAG